MTFVSISRAARAVVRHAPVAHLRASFWTDSRILVIFAMFVLFPCSGFVLNHTVLAYASFGSKTALYSCTLCCSVIPQVDPDIAWKPFIVTIAPSYNRCAW